MTGWKTPWRSRVADDPLHPRPSRVESPGWPSRQFEDGRVIEWGKINLLK